MRYNLWQPHKGNLDWKYMFLSQWWDLITVWYDNLGPLPHKLWATSQKLNRSKHYSRCYYRDWNVIIRCFPGHSGSVWNGLKKNVIISTWLQQQCKPSISCKNIWTLVSWWCSLHNTLEMTMHNYYSWSPGLKSLFTFIFMSRYLLQSLTSSSCNQSLGAQNIYCTVILTTTLT